MKSGFVHSGLTATSLRYGLARAVLSPILALPSEMNRADNGFRCLLASPCTNLSTSAIRSGSSSTDPPQPQDTRCSRIQSPDCCLRPIVPGSTRSVPHGWFFRRGRVHLRYGLQLRSSSLRRRALTRRRRISFPAPLVACRGGTHTRQSIGPYLGTPLFEPPKRSPNTQRPTTHRGVSDGISQKMCVELRAFPRPPAARCPRP
jgi:hypothetical protein